VSLAKWTRSLGRLLIATGVVYGLSTTSLAFAIAHAPNGTRSDIAPIDPPPTELAAHGHVESLSVVVGPPRATLSAWVVEPAAHPLGTVIVLHGVRLDKHSMMPSAEALVDAGYRAVLVDLRGHGHSSGDYLTYGVRDAQDISELLDSLEQRGMTLGPVGVHGFSYGGASALLLAARDPRIRAVVAVSSFASLRGVVRDYVRWQLPSLAPAVPDLWLDSAVDLGALWAGFDPDAARPAEAVAEAPAAVLVIHGAADPQVSVENARRIQRSSGGRAQLLVLDGETHASILADASGSVRKASVDWFRRHLGAVHRKP
jgi:dipeptidyl aminopeptidase/acylaminoacyl peptidase